MRKFRPRPGCVVQAYRFALDPNAGQEAALRSHCGAARTAYNWAVGWVTASWRQRSAEETYGVDEEALTGGGRGRCQVAQGVQRGQEDRPAFRRLVGGELQGGVQHRPGGRCRRVRQLRQVQEGQAEGQADGVAALQVEAQGAPVLPVHHRHHPAGRRRTARHTAPARHDPYARAPGRLLARSSRDRPHPVRDRPPRRGRWFVPSRPRSNATLVRVARPGARSASTWA